MEAVVLCGIQATGKSTFCRERFFSTHIRINLDMLRTRHREELLVQACLAAKQPFVVDNTNPTKIERARYIQAARACGFAVKGYYFESRVTAAAERNAGRPADVQVPERALRGTSARLEIPSRAEGFDELFYVRITDSGFCVEEWRDEI
jgi:predicted kinase